MIAYFISVLSPAPSVGAHRWIGAAAWFLTPIRIFPDAYANVPPADLAWLRASRREAEG
jgi:hypothetical protein